jgi:hypothetical protein
MTPTRKYWLTLGASAGLGVLLFSTPVIAKITFSALLGVMIFLFVAHVLLKNRY